jgi:hypothetical protein
MQKPSPKTEREIEFFGEDGGSIMKPTIQKFSIERPELNYGITILERMRAGSYWTGKKLAIIGKINQEFLNKCPFCRAQKPENLHHYIAECSSWKNQRRDAFGNFANIDQNGEVKIASLAHLKLLSQLVGDEKRRWYGLPQNGVNQTPSVPIIVLDNFIESLLKFFLYTSMERFNRLFPPL